MVFWYFGIAARVGVLVWCSVTWVAAGVGVVVRCSVTLVAARVGVVVKLWDSCTTCVNQALRFFCSIFTLLCLFFLCSFLFQFCCSQAEVLDSNTC